VTFRLGHACTVSYQHCLDMSLGSFSLFCERVLPHAFPKRFQDRSRVVHCSSCMCVVCVVVHCVIMLHTVLQDMSILCTTCPFGRVANVLQCLGCVFMVWVGCDVANSRVCEWVWRSGDDVEVALSI
jgi:hypothetical protein